MKSTAFFATAVNTANGLSTRFSFIFVFHAFQPHTYVHARSTLYTSQGLRFRPDIIITSDGGLKAEKAPDEVKERKPIY